ncbi:hypothetical protein ACFZB9_33125 [Kitasatospora sp. NPDC008050]|uniref:hypothetical protein n=1 Tax=Kitasatospora sp. NPDC008050 TaxID=3364021 RepID=UPI0036E7340C
MPTAVASDYASGDYGDGASGDDAGSPRMVSFPASDQWATSVGGTTLEIGEKGQVLGELGWGRSVAQVNPQGTGYLTRFDRDGRLKAAPGYDDVTGVGSATADFARFFARH